MNHKRPRPRSPQALEAARLLGAQIRLARLERHWSMRELADRIGITAQTVSKVERGDLSVALGSAFEAAALLGIPLFHAERQLLSAERAGIEARAALLPRPLRRRREADDDF